MFVCQRYICPLKISLYTFSNRCGFPYEVVVVTICNKYRIIYVKYTWQFLLDNNKTLILFHVLRICLTIGKFVYLRYIVIENKKLVHHFHAQHPTPPPSTIIYGRWQKVIVQLLVLPKLAEHNNLLTIYFCVSIAYFK